MDRAGVMVPHWRRWRHRDEIVITFAPRFPKLSFVGKLPQGATLEWVALRSCGHIQMKFDALLEDTTHSDTPAACQQNIYLQMQHY